MRMAFEERIRLAARCARLVIIACVLAKAGLGQKSDAVPAAQPVAAYTQDRVFREIRDPNTGAHWMLLKNAQNPAGPGRIVPAAKAGSDMGSIAPAELPAIVIHPGDRLVVEEHTPVLEAHLEGTAINSAMTGSCLAVRLKVGRKVVRAVAIEAGRAALISTRCWEAQR
jgi:hypothetical protein